MQKIKSIKDNILKLVLLTIVVITSTSFKHPIKLTASLIEYEPKTNSLRMECKVFIDDFEKSINKTLPKNINVSNLTKEDIKGLEDYFDTYLKISFNGKELPIKYKTSEVLREYNVLTVKFTDHLIKIKKGDKLEISNTLFFTEFGYIQSNRMTIRIPPYIIEDNQEATMNSYTIPYTF